MNMISEFENALRRIIIKIIGGEDESKYLVSEERIAKWKEKRDIELKKNKGIQLENRLIYYSDFYDLKTVITNNWDLFKLIFHDKKRFEVFFSEVEKYRNTIAHGRNLISSQESLLKGIISDFKNLVTIYHNKNEMKEDYFIEILKVTDNLGNDWGDRAKSKPIIRVGDTLELIVEANDPKDRKIEYEFNHFGSEFKIKQDSGRFKFIIENKLVGKHSLCTLKVSTPETEYENTEIESFAYTVLPK